MEFRILGPLEVLDDAGEPLDLGPRRHRMLLALLAIHANRVVTTDRILEELWGDDAEGKENALWVYISRLRAALGDQDVLVTGDHGYSLVVGDDALDVVQFEAAMAEGRTLLERDPTAASDRIAEGLSLWRGLPLQEFAYEPFARSEITRLEELRATAVTHRIEADLRRGLAGELIGELEVLHQEHPVQERVVGQLMLALYRAGRQSDALRTYERFRTNLGDELGLEPSPDLRLLEEQILLHDSRIQARHRSGRDVTASTEAVNPFKGLRAFTETDAGDFFGRERLVAEVVRRLDAGASMIGLVGPSGSGKSSAVRAGLMPALRKNVIEGSEAWVVAEMVPGAHPFAELEAALLRSTLDAPNSLSDQLEDPDTGILRAMLRVLPTRDARVLLVIDQFEELFTLLDDEAVRARFLAGILHAADDAHARVKVVFTLRSDFYDRPLNYPEFGARMGDAIVNVVPLQPDELEAAARRPAEEAGVELEPPLLAALLTDVVGEPGGLPLFQYALTELFDRRTGATLSAETYKEMEGVRGALGRRADDLYRGLDEREQEVARQLALRLVTIGDGGEWGRRRVPASEILALDLDVVALQAVIEAFAGHRLLTLDRDHVSGSPTVEVAHEALLTNWDRLRGWIEDARSDLNRHNALVIAVREWNDSGHNPDYLLSGERLQDYERWAESSALKLTDEERAFIAAGGDDRDRAETDRRSQEAGARRTKRRARAALAAVLIVVLGIAASVFALTRPSDPVRVATFGRGSSSVDELVSSGYSRAERELGAEVEYLGEQRFSDLNGEYRSLGENGTDIVIMENFAIGQDWLPLVVREFPDTAFASVEPFTRPPDGTYSVFFADEQVGYLAGVSAGLASETGVIAFLGGVQYDGLEAWRAGFEQGAAAVNPDISVLAAYTSSDFAVGFESVAAGRERALHLYRAGADVVMHAAGSAGLGAIEAAAQHTDETGVHVWAIGADSDWSLEIVDRLQPHLLTSALKRFDMAVYELVRQHNEGELVQHQVLTVSSEAIGLAESDYLTDADLAIIAAQSDELASGAITLSRIPAGELQPPLGVEVVGSIELVWDGALCDLRWPETTPVAGTALQVELVNQTAEPVKLFVFHDNWASLSLPSVPNGTTTGYLTLEPGEFLVGCGTDSGSSPWVHGGVIRVG